MNGFEYSLWEIDEALRELIPDLQRKEATPRVFEELGINELLDQRNELVYLMGASAMEVLVDVRN